MWDPAAGRHPPSLGYASLRACAFGAACGSDVEASKWGPARKRRKAARAAKAVGLSGGRVARDRSRAGTRRTS